MRYVFIALATTLLLAAGAAWWSFRPASLPVPSLSTALPPAHPPEDMSLSALPTGAMHSLEVFAWRGGRWGQTIDYGMTGFLIHHPRGDLLVDTGFGRQVDAQVHSLPLLMQWTTTYSKGQPIAAQFDAAGYDYRQLKAIVLTHAHWDHIGGIPDMPGVPIWLDPAELEFIHSDASMSSLARSFGQLPYQPLHFADGPYLGYADSDDVWGDGSVVLVRAPGHTPGSLIVFVCLPSGQRYAFIGDIVWRHEALEIPAERPLIPRLLLHEDSGEVREQIGHLAAIHRLYPQIDMIPAHDPVQAATVPAFPQVTH